MDIVYIERLAVEAIVGIFDFERETPQTVWVDIEMGTDIRPAAKSKDIAHAINYKAVSDDVRTLIVEQQYLLVETMAEDIAELVLSQYGAIWVAVKIGKPQAISDAQAVGVKIERGVKC